MEEYYLNQTNQVNQQMQKKIQLMIQLKKALLKNNANSVSTANDNKDVNNVNTVNDNKDVNNVNTVNDNKDVSTVNNNKDVNNVNTNNKLNNNESNNNEDQIGSNCDTNIFIDKWLFHKNATIFRLSNKAVQVTPKKNTMADISDISDTFTQ